MMEWLAVVLLIGIGIILIGVELIFVPGTTIVGLIGLGCMVVGIVLGFQYFGSGTGWAILGLSSVIGFGIIIYGLRSGAWEKFALKRSIDAKVNQEMAMDLQIGQRGETISALRPIGKAEFENKVYEVRSYGNYVKQKAPVQIVKIDNKKIYVEPVETE